LQRRKHLLNPRRGFYVIVPPQFASWGAPPPPWYIDALMRHEHQAYYVGLLKAAELHGATHQAVMEFQVVAAKRLPKIHAGRNMIVFYYRKDMRAVASGLEDHKTDTGTMKISTVELTALDLLRYPQAAGGIDNIATVLTDLGPKIDAAKLAALSQKAERPVAQRLGYLLGRLGHEERTEPMHAALKARGSLTWTELDRKESRDPDFAPEPVERNDRWRVIVRRFPEVDE
jgi:predicted transcriptional regulator of viral defense system